MKPPMFLRVFANRPFGTLLAWVMRASTKTEFNEDGVWMVRYQRVLGRRGYIEVAADNVDASVRCTYTDPSGWILFVQKVAGLVTHTVHPPTIPGSPAPRTREPRCFRCHDTGKLVASGNPCSCENGEFFRRLG